MKIVVLVKRVPDTASAFEVNAAGTGVSTDRLKFIMSPYDEHAVQEAVNIKAASDCEVVVITLGDEGAKEILLPALAMGADRAVFITGPGVESLGSRGVAEALAKVIADEGPDLVFAGKQAVDDDASQVAERVAELLEWPHASVITRFSLDGGTAVVEREVEGGNLTLSIPLPAIFTAQKGLNKPEYPKLPNIMKAKKKPVDEKTLESLGLSAATLANRVTVESMALPRQERLARLIDGDAAGQVAELVRILKEDEKAF